MKNALKFCNNQDIKIKTAYHEIDEKLVVHIIDKGRGIRQEEKTKLFQLFGVLERTEDSNEEGIGMGLLIC